MPFWKALLLSLYYHGSMPVRWWYRCACAAAGRAPAAVLCYHRIADDDATPWTVSNRMFARQIAWLRRHFDLVSLEETQRRIRGEANRRVSVSITFDDGYSENCRHAIPLLVKEGIPCTYFITVRNVLENQPFDHDLEQGYCFAPNTVEQIKAMAAAGIEIGVHGWDHVNLGLVADRQVLHHEVVTAKQELRAMLGRPARYFAFPYGHYAALSREAFDLAARAGYEAACSAYGGFNVPGDDAFHLQRIVADNSMLRLKNWTTFDPRKRRIVRFEYLAPRKPYVSTTSPSTRG